MLFPLTFIVVGVYFLFSNAGWTLNFTPGWSTYWPAVLILIGLFIMLRKR